jgi:hypothetical protein
MRIKRISSVVFILFIAITLFSQKTAFEIKLQVEGMKGDFDYGKYGIYSPSIGVNYYIHNWVDVGASFGFVKGGHYASINETSAIGVNAVTFGVNSCIHILPLFTKKVLRFDVYAIPTLMAATKYYPITDDYTNIKEWSKLYFNYGIGAGVKYSFTRRFGIYIEFSRGIYFPNENKRAKLGFALKI